MQNMFVLLFVLACPVGMGLMMWFMMRTGKEQRPSDATVQREGRQRAFTLESAPRSSTHPSSPSPSPLNAIWNCLQMCLNWKVLVGLAIAAALVGIVAPQFFWVAIPLLVVLACPLSMIGMMRSMNHRREMTGGNEIGCAACEPGLAEPFQALEQPAHERSSTSPVKW